jgi:hypothetical protein
MTWSAEVNGFLYEFVGLVLQASQAHNVSVPCGRKYNVPSEKITIDDTVATYYPNMTSYTPAAIPGVDDFNDGSTTIRDLFDIIVEDTREVTPACKTFTIRSRLFISLTRPQPSRSRVDTRVSTGRNTSNKHVLTTARPDTLCMDGPSVL